MGNRRGGDNTASPGACAHSLWVTMNSCMYELDMCIRWHKIYLEPSGLLASDTGDQHASPADGVLANYAGVQVQGCTLTWQAMQRTGFMPSSSSLYLRASMLGPGKLFRYTTSLPPPACLLPHIHAGALADRQHIWQEPPAHHL
jgi:hypothetical protein